MTVNGIEITQDTILATRVHFADIHKTCIEDALNGRVRVNDLDKYVESEKKSIANAMDGTSDHTVTFIQRALWIQTGECIAILS